MVRIISTAELFGAIGESFYDRGVDGPGFDSTAEESTRSWPVEGEGLEEAPTPFPKKIDFGRDALKGATL